MNFHLKQGKVDKKVLFQKESTFPSRLLMLEMQGGIYEDDNREYYHNHTSGIAVVPFSFGTLRTHHGIESPFTGNSFYEEIKEYLDEAPGIHSWPSWEMNDHDLVEGMGRFPIKLNNCLFLVSLLLPGTGIIYYGDEIGMSDNIHISYDDVQDPYCQEPYCSADEYHDGKCLCVDPSRTPMQVCHE